MRPRTILAAALLAASANAALAQGPGFAGSTVGLTASGVPANPFASNLPSAPPPAFVERRGRRVMRGRTREPVPLPPGRVPR